MRTKTGLKAAIAIAFLAFVGWRVYVAAVFRPAKNFHEIDPGKYYRSAQLTGREFEEAIEKYGIKTIVNLRGSGPGETWYEEEVAAAAAHGVKLVSFGFSTKHVPHRASLLPLLDVLRSAERPILVHCRSGADRTGEVSAIYKMLYMGQSKEEALDQLTLPYLHVEAFAPAKKMFIADWQGEEWARNAYDPCQPKYKDYYEQNSGNCPTRFPPSPVAEDLKPAPAAGG